MKVKYEKAEIEIIMSEETPFTLRSTGTSYPSIMSNDEDPTFS